MFSTVPVITDAGMTLLLRAINGEKITLDHFEVGSGSMPGNKTPQTMMALGHKQFDVAISDAKREEENNFIELTGHFDNKNEVTQDFRWTELGLVAKDSAGTPYLYAYANDGINAGMLKAGNSDVVTEQTITMFIAVDDAENIQAFILPNATYASKDEFDKHVSDPHAHNITAETVGLGNVPNVSTNDQTPTYTEESSDESLVSGEKLSVAMGKTAHAVNRLWEHLKDRGNPHKTGLFAAAAVDFINAWGNPDVISTFTGNGASAATLSVNGTNCRGQYIDLSFSPSKVVIIIPYGSITIGHSQSQLLYSSGLFDILIGRTARIAVIGPMMNYYHDGCGNCRSSSPQYVLNRNHGGAVVYNNGFIVQSYNNSDNDAVMYMNVKNVVYTYLAWK